MNEIISNAGYIALTISLVVAIVKVVKADDDYIAETERLINDATAN